LVFLVPLNLIFLAVAILLVSTGNDLDSLEGSGTLVLHYPGQAVKLRGLAMWLSFNIQKIIRFYILDELIFDSPDVSLRGGAGRISFRRQNESPRNIHKYINRP
jgi:hypothetical protein